MTEPQTWLGEGESRAWLGVLAMTAVLDSALDRQLQTDAGLTHGQYGILARLSESPGRSAHMSSLAMATSNSQSRLSHAVAGLEARGWVSRSRCPVNGRGVHATLTDAGQALVTRAAPGHVDAVRRLVFDHLTPEQVEALTTISGTVLAALKDEGYEVPLAAAETD